MVSLIEFTQKEKGISREAAEAIWLDEVPLRRMGRAEDFGKLAAVLVSDCGVVRHRCSGLRRWVAKRGAF